MANPTGTTYLQADPNYTWVDRDVYEIQQTDEVEGAAFLASFGGQGVDNQPHQQLLHKANYIHTKMLADEATIYSLQSLVGMINSGVALNGWLKLGCNDVKLGKVQLIIQWGTISVLQYVHNPPLPPSLTFTYPIPFPNAVFLLYPYWQSDAPMLTIGANIDAEQVCLAGIAPFGLKSGTIGYSLAVDEISGAHNLPGVTGVGWVALGY